VALFDALSDLGHLLADVVDGLRGAALGLDDPVGQPFRDLADLGAQALQRLGMKLIGAAQTVFHRPGDPGDLAAHLFDGLRAALLGAVHTAVQGLGHGQDLAAHGFDRVGRTLLRRRQVLRHLAQPGFHLARTAGGQALGDLGAGVLDAAGQLVGQDLQPVVQIAAHAAVGGVHPLVELDQGVPQAIQRLAGARLGVGQPLGQPRDDIVDQPGAVADLRLRQTLFQSGQRRPAAGVDVKDFTGHAGHGILERPHRLGGSRPGHLGLDEADTLGGARLFGGQLFGGGVEARGHRQMFALGGLDAGHGVAHGMFDAGDGQTRAGLGGLDAIGQPVERDGDASHVIGSSQIRPAKYRRVRHVRLRDLDRGPEGTRREMILGGDLLGHLIF
jgi:hypothetical protein